MISLVIRAEVGNTNPRKTSIGELVKRVELTLGLILFAISGTASAQEATWPDLSRPARTIGGGTHDSAVVIGVENYSFVPPVPGAEQNARAWYDYLTQTLGVPPESIRLLTGVDATKEEIQEAARLASERANQKGTLWFIFIGHGAPSSDGKDGLLVGVDAQQKSASLSARSLGRSELLKALSSSRAKAIRVIIDACFSGRGQDGATIAPGLQPLLSVGAPAFLDQRMTVLTAARGDQFAGALPGTHRPAFSYLVLGGLRGWAPNQDGKITGEGLVRYSQGALDATLRGRNQTPDIIGSREAIFGVSTGETAPDLAALAKVTSGSGSDGFTVSAFSQLPKIRAPESIQAPAGVEDWRDVDVDALGQYDAAMKFDKSDAEADEKAKKWRSLVKSAPRFAGQAEERAIQWEKYSKELAANEEARESHAEAMEADWAKLGKLLSLDIIPTDRKKRWAAMYVRAYGSSSDENPHVAELQPFLPSGTIQITPESRGKVGLRGRAGVVWIPIDGGTFNMGSSEGDSDELPTHTVAVQGFKIARSLVTFGQYKQCVKSGACSPLGCVSPADSYPVYCANWDQATSFSKWVGGRLPTEAEWEYAASEPGHNIFPWGNSEPTCDYAVMGGESCGVKSPSPICTKESGNTKSGICDMAGNVWEWTQDWYHESYNGAPRDGSAWEYPVGARRVIRGGSWSSGRKSLRSTNRGNAPPDIFPSETKGESSRNLLVKIYRLRPVSGNKDAPIGFRPVRP